MDVLLTLIEDSVTWKGALGFNKGAVTGLTPTGKGKSFIQHCEDIAEAFFLGHAMDFKFTKGNLPVLKTIHINSLKSTFMENHNKLGEIGYGLVMTGCLDELYEGSDAANVYEVIDKKFLCCKAVSNSQSVLDLTVLGLKNDDEEDNLACHMPTLIINEDAPLGSLSPCGNLPGEKLDDEDDDNFTLLKLKLAIPLKCVAESPVGSRSAKKWKTPQDLVKEVAGAECEACLVMNETNSRECTTCEQIKHKDAHDTAVIVEGMHIKSQKEQAAMQWAHELLMMEQQIELAHLCSGHSAFIDPQLQG
ncbi:hypothetical protein BS17DRAFT_770589 [Gyrodon lividus]|nr:hypothetical protein BS17DRAFT_770589 [Gyrodon lividus]